MLGVQNIVNLTGGSIQGETTAFWSFDQITAWTSLTGTSYLGGSLALSFSGSTVGANGMDVTGFPAGLSDLYVYAIYNSGTTTWSTLGTIVGQGEPIYGGAHMPSGYTASALLWSGKVALGAFVGFQQVGNLVSIVPNGQLWTRVVLPGLNTRLYTSFSLASQIPINAKSVTLNQVSPGILGAPLSVAMDSIGTGQVVLYSLGSLLAVTPNPPYFEMPLTSPPLIYYIYTNAPTFFSDPAIQLNVIGWTI